MKFIALIAAEMILCLFPPLLVDAQDRTVTLMVRDARELQTALRYTEKQGPQGVLPTAILLAPGSYSVSDTLVISQSNVSIYAPAGATLSLADHINKPVISVGSQEETPSYTVENIRISGITIDGNKANQDSEFHGDKEWIRNNGIDVRAVYRLTIENCVSRNNRSGGLVISWGSADIHVVNSEFDDNYFDGIACYASRRIYTSNSSMKNNNSAGISLDNGVSECLFSNCILDGNGDVGIFCRFADEIRLSGCTVKNSGSWAVFLGHDDGNNGVHDVMFTGCQFLDNQGGLLLSSSDESQSSHTSITGSVFRGNAQADRPSFQTYGSVLWTSGTVFMD